VITISFDVLDTDDFWYKTLSKNVDSAETHDFEKLTTDSFSSLAFIAMMNSKSTGTSIN
jgi:hypothetical protein